MPSHAKNKPVREPVTAATDVTAKSGEPFIGRAMRRIEDQRLITGQGTYVSDIRLDNALHLTFLRSPFAFGRITACDISGAAGMPGIAAVFTGADVAHLGRLSVNPILDTVKSTEYPILAGKRVMAAGQPVAAIIAETVHAGANAAEAIYFDIDPDRARLSIDETGPQTDLFPGIKDNIAAAQNWQSGDIEAAFDQADYIVNVSLQHPRLAPCPMEPRSTAAEFNRDSGILTVWLSSQTPHRGCKELADILDFPIDRIRVITPDVGGAFGMKASLYPEDVMITWAALELKCAVRWTSSRSEDLLAATHGRGTKSKGSLAVTRDGRFLGLKADTTCPLGHWLPSSAAIPAWNAARILPGPYNVEAIAIATRGVLTNTGPVGIYRGAGRPEAAALMERLVDEAACVTGFDPLEIRKKNLLPANALPIRRPTGTKLDSGDYFAAIEMLESRANYEGLRRQQAERRRNGELVGIGIAFYVEPCGQGWESARVTLHPDGSIVAATGTSSQGHGRETAFAQIVADVFDVSPDTVKILSGDTDTSPAGIGALASRSTAIGGSALLQAAREVHARRRNRNDIDTPIEASVIYESDGEAWGYGCYLAMISIDRETGTPRVEKLICIDDIGTVINPMLVEGQIMGGMAQGLGEALMEQIVYNEDGQLLTGSLMDYALPRATDMPPVEIGKLATPSPLNLLGAKGVGEAGTIGTPAAILNAALDALHPLGVHTLDMPLTSEKIWRAMRSAAKDSK
ncbi:MAG: xanthine dehydrogenase family protein molybdopterin-binding subunit [Fimbriimonadaceae bacterium]|nr:xanthine dehydrogenase family protein molybdopterin-binding subunit [Alphaproteobacteria bacterium]